MNANSTRWVGTRMDLKAETNNDWAFAAPRRESFFFPMKNDAKTKAVRRQFSSMYHKIKQDFKGLIHLLT